ncbi:MAG TPA: hypothetical protein V6D26_09830 [Stenomitos sp.]
MPKSPDKSETVRIKSSFAEFIREESKRLNLGFLDTLYYIINAYRYEITEKSVSRRLHETRSHQELSIPPKEEAKPQEKIESKNEPEISKENQNNFYDDFA